MDLLLALLALMAASPLALALLCVVGTPVAFCAAAVPFVWFVDLITE